MKIGDKVRVLEGAEVLDADGSGNTRVGDILVIEYIWETAPFPIYTSVASGICWPERDLEVVE